MYNDAANRNSLRGDGRVARHERPPSTPSALWSLATIWNRFMLASTASGLAMADWRWCFTLRGPTQERLKQLVAERTTELEQANARLGEEIVRHKETEAQARKTRDELATLLASSQTILSTLDLEPLLDRILEQLAHIVDYDTAFVGTLDGSSLTIRAFRGQLDGRDLRGTQMNLLLSPPLRAIATDHRPLLIADLESNPAIVTYFEQAIQQRLPGLSLSAVPLVARGRALGVLCLLHRRAGAYGPADLTRVQAFANLVALALENAQLYQRAREGAILEERTRLARELHDAVTQTLFSASLVAEALPKTWRGAPPPAVRGAEHVRQLTRGALAEMRTLLVELRPQALTEKPLGVLLKALCTATGTRLQVPVSFVLRGSGGLPAEVQIALYRIAQEALNNVVKHADASRVRVLLAHCERGVVLVVRDDGLGFAPEAVAPDSFGLAIMRERAAGIGARVRIRSRPGRGAAVTVAWCPPGMRVVEGETAADNRS